MKNTGNFLPACQVGWGNPSVKFHSEEKKEYLIIRDNTYNFVNVTHWKSKGLLHVIEYV